MGTSNFYYKNASKVFAICMSYTDDETQEDIHPDSFEFEDTVSDIQSSIQDMAKANNLHFAMDGFDPHELRSFPSTVLGTLSSEIDCLDNSIYIELTCVVRSGYYEGACLDWSIGLRINNDTFELTDDWEVVIDELEADCDSSADDVMKLAIFKPYASTWVEEKKTMMINEVERIYAECSGVQLEVVATFSNGETIYKQSK